MATTSRTARRRHGRLVRAFANVSDRDPLTRLLIAGEPRRDVDPAKYAELIAALGIEDRVWFRPQYVASDLVPYYFGRR